MKNTFKKSRSLSLGLLLLITVCCLLLAISVSASASDSVITDASLSSGRAFDDGEGIQLGKELDKMPRTYEAVVYVPSDVNSKGAIISNYYPLSNTPHIDFAIGIGGTTSEARPMLDITDVNNNRTRVEFRSNIKGDSWVHVVVTHESNAAGDVYTCYVNGEKVTKQNINYWVDGVKDTEANLAYGELDMSKMENSASMYLGQAYGYSSTSQLGADDPYNEGEAYQPTNFKGRIKNVALYSSVLSADQIKANYQSGIDATRKDIILCYDLTSTETSGETKSGYITDISGNGYNTVPLFHVRGEELNKDDFDYSFAILGDTQFLVDRDVNHGTSYTSDIYNWIIANKDAKKIARVLGVGDIVESGKLSDDFYVTNEEEISNLSDSDKNAIAQWEYAVSQFDRLQAAGIPYSITWGYNHDGLYGKEFTYYFGDKENFTNSAIGFYFSDSNSANYSTRLANYYQKFEVEGVKYMVLCIEFMPSYDVLNWADSVIDENLDHKVIISTHYFIDQLGEIPNDQDKAAGQDDRIRADVLQAKWDILANENENVEMILCGHVARQNNIVQAYTVAKSGQKVAQFLIDPQQMDRFYGYDDTGVVAMFYFSNEGNDVSVEFVSTAKTMRAREAAEAEGKDPNTVTDILYGSKNEFTFNFPEPAKTITTEYGVIPEEYMSAEKYPFVIFDNNKNCIGAATHLSISESDGAIGIAKNALKANKWDGESYGSNPLSMYILMRRDVTMDPSENYSNTAQVQGRITLDLGGYRIETNNDQHLLNLSHKGWTSSGDAIVFPTELVIKNGKITTHNTAIIKFTVGSNGEGKKYNVSFEDVDFDVKGALTEFAAYNSTNTSYKFYPEITFENCTIDLSGSSSSNVVVFTLGNSKPGDVSKKTAINPTYIIKGGSVISDKANYTITSTSNDSTGILDFSPSGKNTYTYLKNPASAPTGTFGGGLIKFKESGSGTYKLYYTDIKNNDIAADSLASYTFLIVDENNRIVDKSNMFYGAASSSSAIHLAKEYLSDNRWVKQSDGSFAYEGKNPGDAPLTVTVLFMRDYAFASDEKFNNLSQIQGTLIVDLNGFTLSAYESNNLFPTSLKAWSASGDENVFPSEMLVKNGNIEIYNSPLIKFTLNTNAPGKKFTYSFEDVNFYAKGSATNLFVDHSSANSCAYYTNVVLKNCTVDISESKAKSAITFFKLGNTSTNTSATIIGGEIIVGAKSYVLYSKDSGTGVFTFESLNGVYTVINGKTAPADSYLTQDGVECVFVKASDSTYMLYPKVMVGYKINTSVTLYSNFVYNIYIPEANFNKAMINGKDVVATLVEIDGANYYHIAVDLAAAESLSDITLCVTLNSGSATVDANCTISVLKYVKSVINGNYDDTTKTLMKDMLVYASAAHTYFENELDSAKAAEVAVLLDGYTKEMPIGETKKPTDKTYFTDVEVYLGEVPSFRFYLADGYDVDDFTFTVGGKAVEVTSEAGYVEIAMYAYRMIDDVTFTVKGTEVSGTYNLYSYYDYAESLKIDALTAIVEALMKYSVSAKAYRDSVVNK